MGVLPSDGEYIDAYNEVFEILKTIFQGSNGYPNFIKNEQPPILQTLFSQIKWLINEVFMSISKRYPEEFKIEAAND